MYILFAIFLIVHTVNCHVSYQPEQVHIAYGKNVYEIVVTWSTVNNTPNSVVEYGINGLALTSTGSSKKFVDGGQGKHTQYIHRVVLNALTPNSKYGKFFLLSFLCCIVFTYRLFILLIIINILF